MKKICTRCHLTKEVSEFYRNKTSKYKNGIQSQCKKCIVDRSIKNEKLKPKHSDHRHGKNLRRKYWNDGTWREALEKYTKLLLKQKGVCAVCGLPETKSTRGRIRTLSVDHCHDTGKVRGLLCDACNIAEGLLKTPKVAEALARYMRRHR